MSRFLEADKVLVFKLYDDLTEEFYEKEFTIQNFIDTYAVDGCPQVVDAEPIRHGHWISERLCSTKGGTYGIRRCSNCEYCYNDFGDEWNYCPDCGAKMDEVEE